MLSVLLVIFFLLFEKFFSDRKIYHWSNVDGGLETLCRSWASLEQVAGKKWDKICHRCSFIFQDPINGVFKEDCQDFYCSIKIQLTISFHFFIRLISAIFSFLKLAWFRERHDIGTGVVCLFQGFPSNFVQDQSQTIRCYQSMWREDIYWSSLACVYSLTRHSAARKLPNLINLNILLAISTVNQHSHFFAITSTRISTLNEKMRRTFTTARQSASVLTFH